MRTLRREAMRPPLIWSRWGSGCCGGSIPSRVQHDVQVQVFRDSEQSLQHQHRWWSPGRCRVRQRRAPWGGWAGPRRLPSIWTWLWGSDLQGTGSVCCSLLRVLSVSKECLEMSHRSKYTWASGWQTSTDGSPGQWDSGKGSGDLGFRIESLAPLFPLGPERSRRSDDTEGRRTCPPILHSTTAPDTWALEMDRHLESLFSWIIISKPQPNSSEVSAFKLFLYYKSTFYLFSILQHWNLREDISFQTIIKHDMLLMTDLGTKKKEHE